jgi:glycosyltransferase involved in cell wall biosynthesis
MWGVTPSRADLAALDDLCETVWLEPFNRSKARKGTRFAWDLLRGRAFHKSYFKSRSAAAAFRQQIAGRSFDVVIASQLYTYGYVPQSLHHILVFDSVNAEARRLTTMRSTGVTPRAMAARLQTAPVQRFEAEVASRVARILAVSEEELAYFAALAPDRVDLIPNGVDTKTLAARKSPPRSRSLLFMGSLSSGANVDAVVHFEREILGRLAYTDATLTVLGIAPPPSVHRAARRAKGRIQVTGFVESTQPYIDRSRALVVPLRQGGGTRLKILEALASGLPVVTTSIGCEGLGLEHERDVLVADDAASFARCIDQVLADDALCLELARNGRRTVEKHFDWSMIGARLNEVLLEVVDKATKGSAGGLKGAQAWP